MFKHLEVKDGLSNNQINSIYKDSRGFMWFGTASGLNRYDGNFMKVYRSRKEDVKSLPENYIEKIQEDAEGHLWIHTGVGYVVYNPDSDTFDRNSEAWLKRKGIEGYVQRLYIDSRKTFWVYVGGKGLYRYGVDDKEALCALVSNEDWAKAGVVDIAEFDGDILLMYETGVLVCVDGMTLKLKWMEDGIASDLGKAYREAFTMYVDKTGKLWIYNVVGAWTYLLHERKWDVRMPRKEGYDAVRAVMQDKYGRIWVGRDQRGIEVYDGGKKSVVLSNDPGDARTLPNNTVTVLYEDSSGTMWVGTYKKGVAYYNESIFKFSLADVGDVNCVEDGGDSVVWLGTNGGGLVRWNRQTDQRKTFMHVAADRNSISGDVVVTMLRDSKGRLWAGTYWSGLNCYDGHRFIHYRHEAGEANTLAYDNVWALAEDRDGNIWIGTLGKGVQCLNPSTGVFTTYANANSGLVSDYVLSICIGRDNRLIIGTSYGMSFLDLDTRTIKNFAGGRSDTEQLSNQSISQVYEDSRGLIWVATREGLNVYSPRQDRLYEVPLKPDFSKLFVLGIVEDENRGMWVTAGSELINILPQLDEQTGELTFSCRSYNDKDGLQSCDFNQRSMKRLLTGEIMAGGLYGVNCFRPNEIKYNRAQPKVMFTGFQLFNEEVEVGKKYGGRVVLPHTLFETEKIVLDYAQNIFTVFFASDNYVLPEKTSYQYKLEGFNKEWLTSQADMHRVTYTNLAPGSYVLKVKATTSDGYVGSDEAQLKIVILPPFWMTPWAYACYALLVVGVLVAAFLAVQRRERNRYRIRQIEQDARRAEEVNQMKFRFFTNVSHELRTPLTLIISPLEEMMKGVSDEKTAGKLKMIHRNAMRLLNLVNQLLDFRKNEMAGLHLNLSEGDIVAYARNICNSFLMLSDKKDIRLTFFSSADSLQMAFDEDKVGKILMNLLSNAFKFTPDGGQVDVSLEVIEGSSEMLEIKVSDTGIGIKDSEKEHIFDRFYQIEHTEGGTRPSGSGIGLSLVRDFVALHGGMVQVFDNVGTGAVFVVDLPVRHLDVGVARLPDGMEKDGLPVVEENVPDEIGEQTPAVSEKVKPVVLLVDDNSDFLAFMKDGLSLYFTVKSATNGQEALKLIPELMPDLIVSDWMMPVMDGNELCRQVKSSKKTAGIPFVLLTAKQSVENKVEGLTIGADDYVTKPFNMEVMILRMRRLIELSRRNKSRHFIEPAPSEVEVTSLDEKLIGDAIKYVEANIARSDLSVEELSRQLGMSRAHLYKKLLQITGKTPIEFIRVIRLKRAAQLLRESQQNVSEIAYQLGFNNPKYFSKYFKDEFGVLPSVYQEKEGK